MGLNAYLVFSQVLGVGVSVHAALAGCLIAAGLVGVLAIIHALRLILAAVPDAIKLATVSGRDHGRVACYGSCRAAG
jgi:xanthine/uracil/vitamin C permease (AzgA family)